MSTYYVFDSHDNSTTVVRENNEFAAINTYIAASTPLAIAYDDNKFAQVYDGLCVECEENTRELQA